jgi:hypothetical protein
MVRSLFRVFNLSNILPSFLRFSFGGASVLLRWCFGRERRTTEAAASHQRTWTPETRFPQFAICGKTVQHSKGNSWEWPTSNGLCLFSLFEGLRQ